MPKDVYKKLAGHLDQMPGGYPATESGVELRILRRLFSPEEAALALKMSLLPEKVSVIAHRARLSREEAADRLEEMARKGLIFRISRPKRPLRYAANQFVIGIWEYHVNDLDPDLIQDFNRYLPDLFDLKSWKKSPQLRTVPVKRSLPVDLKVFPYEDAVELVKRHDRFVEAPCICRREHRMVGKGCDKPEGACLVLGTAADYYAENGLGRRISRDEALGILKLADEAGLVLQPSFAKNIANICCCCGCCCQVLGSIKKHPEPAALVANPFIAALESESCIGCGVCERRCQMEAIRMEGDKAVLDERRCIGCGLCVTTCPSGALTLIRKPEPRKPDIPDNLVKAAVRRARARGGKGQWGLIKFATRSMWGRLRKH